jgi:2-dehydro-3-deoxyphosphogluconate aldolase/(4S)-4-hydroxy-2-oxoglutarate aldolase
MEKNEVFDHIKRARVIAVLRLKTVDALMETAGAILKGGINILEITLDSVGAFAAINALRQVSYDNLVVGAGTVMDVDDARQAIDAGAQFLVTPVLLPEVIEFANVADILIVSGAFTPTEAHQAYASGADLVKIFPSSAVTPAYLQAINGPLPDIPLMPTGGINAENAGQWLAAGAVAVGIGGALSDEKLINAGDFIRITSYAKEIVMAIRPDP